MVVEQPVTSGVSVSFETMEEEVEIKSVNAFTKEDLYRSRAEKLKRSRRKKVSQPVAELLEDVPEEPVTKETIIEIVQIVDDGKVIASKRVK